MCWSRRCRRPSSRARTRCTPLLATLKGFAVAIVSALLLGRLFGADGIAASIALGAWSSALALIRHGAATFGLSIDAAARRRLPRIVAGRAGDGRAAVADRRALCCRGPQTCMALAQAAVLGILIAGGDRDLRPVAGPARGDRLARRGRRASGEPRRATCATEALMAIDGAWRRTAFDGAHSDAREADHGNH